MASLGALTEFEHHLQQLHVQCAEKIALRPFVGDADWQDFRFTCLAYLKESLAVYSSRRRPYEALPAFVLNQQLQKLLVSGVFVDSEQAIVLQHCLEDLPLPLSSSRYLEGDDWLPAPTVSPTIPRLQAAANPPTTAAVQPAFTDSTPSPAHHSPIRQQLRIWGYSEGQITHALESFVHECIPPAADLTFTAAEDDLQGGGCIVARWQTHGTDASEVCLDGLVDCIMRGVVIKLLPPALAAAAAAAAAVTSDVTTTGLDSHQHQSSGFSPRRQQQRSPKGIRQSRPQQPSLDLNSAGSWTDSVAAAAIASAVADGYGSVNGVGGSSTWQSWSASDAGSMSYFGSTSAYQETSSSGGSGDNGSSTPMANGHSPDQMDPPLIILEPEPVSPQAVVSPEIISPPQAAPVTTTPVQPISPISPPPPPPPPPPPQQRRQQQQPPPPPPITATATFSTAASAAATAAAKPFSYSSAAAAAADLPAPIPLAKEAIKPRSTPVQQAAVLASAATASAAAAGGVLSGISIVGTTSALAAARIALLSKHPSRAPDGSFNDPDMGRMLMVRNLPFAATADDVAGHFCSCANLASVQMSRSKTIPGRPPSNNAGYCHVTFKTRDDAALAMTKLQTTELVGHETTPARPLVLERMLPRDSRPCNRPGANGSGRR